MGKALRLASVWPAVSFGALLISNMALLVGRQHSSAPLPQAPNFHQHQLDLGMDMRAVAAEKEHAVSLHIPKEENFLEEKKTQNRDEQNSNLMKQNESKVLLAREQGTAMEMVVVVPVLGKRGSPRPGLCALVKQLLNARPKWALMVFDVSPPENNSNVLLPLQWCAEGGTSELRDVLVPYNSFEHGEVNHATLGDSSTARRRQTVDFADMLRAVIRIHGSTASVLVVEDDSFLCPTFLDLLDARPMAAIWFAGFGGTGVLVAATHLERLRQYLTVEQHASNLDILLLKYAQLVSMEGQCIYRAASKHVLHLGASHSSFNVQHAPHRRCGDKEGSNYLFLRFGDSGPVPDWRGRCNGCCAPGRCNFQMCLH